MSLLTVTDVHIFAVRVEGTKVFVTVYGGPDNAFGTVTFTQPNERAAQAMHDRVYGWMTDDAPVFVTKTAEEIRLGRLS